MVTRYTCRKEETYGRNDSTDLFLFVLSNFLVGSFLLCVVLWFVVVPCDRHVVTGFLRVSSSLTWSTLVSFALSCCCLLFSSCLKCVEVSSLCPFLVSLSFGWTNSVS